MTILNIKLIKSVPFRDLQSTASISLAYEEDFNSLQHFYSFAPGQWAEKLVSVDANYDNNRRQPLVKELLSYHQRLNAPREVLDNIERLRDSQTLVVMSGQQPGLLTGPLYTIYKALSAIKLSQKLSQEFNREIVPVYWSATEDHDLEEINQASFLNRQDMLPKIEFPVPDNYHGWRVGEIPLGQGEKDDFFLQLEQLLDETGYKSEVIEFVKSNAEVSDNWGDWFGRQMLALFGRWGLVMMDPNLPGMRRLMSPVVRSAIEEPLLFSRLVNEQGEKLAALGYKDQVKRPPQACCFFIIEDGQRRRVNFVHGKYKTSEKSYSREELLKKLDEEPQAFSCNVVLRPACGEFLFPDLAYIGGNAEIAYFAQLKPVFEHLGLQMPIVLPRHSLTLVEARIQKIMVEYSLDPVQIKSDTAQHLKKVGRSYCRLASHDYWEEIKKQVMTPLKKLQQEAELERMAIPPLETGVNKIAWQLNQLEEKVIQQCQKNNQLLRERLTRAHKILFPQDKLQERSLNFYYFYNKYGEDFLPALLEALPDDWNQHYFLGIEVG